jgi:predicted nucleotidyltransferase
MDMPLLPQDFKEFLKLLNSKKVEYLIVGGYAVGFYGYPRATADMDVWIAIEEENAIKITGVLKEFGFNFPDVVPEIFQKRDNVIRMGNPPIRIEILTSISGLDFSKAYSERIVENIDGIPVNFISLGNLLINKKASGRHKDLDDIEHLK